MAIGALAENLSDGMKNTFKSISISWLLSKFGAYIFLVLLLIVSGIISPIFLGPDNIGNLLVQLAPLGIVVVGQAFVIITKGLDLSVASVMATAAVMTTMFDSNNGSIIYIILASFMVAVCVGLLNGFLVTKRGVSPFLATLATAVVLEGFRFSLTSGAPSGNIPPLLKYIGNGSLLGIPISLLIMFLVLLVFWFILHRSVFGRQVFMTGENETGASLVGINTVKTITICYIISALLATIAGLLLAGFVGIVDNYTGRGFELDSIVAAVIGGVALSGGRGSIQGALAGGAVLIVVFNMVLLIGVPVEFQIIIKGLVVILATAFYVRRT